MQLIVRSLTTHVLDVSPDANVEVKCFLFPCSKKNLHSVEIYLINLKPFADPNIKIIRIRLEECANSYLEALNFIS